VNDGAPLLAVNNIEVVYSDVILVLRGVSGPVQVQDALDHIVEAIVEDATSRR